MLLNFDDSNRRVSDLIPGIASGGSSNTNSGLAASVGKGGDAIGRMASTPLIAGRLPRLAQGGAVSHPHLFHVHFPDAGGGSTTTGDINAGVLLAQTLSGGGLRGGAGGMGDRMSSAFSRRIGSTSFAICQLGASDQVGVPSAEAVGGSSVGDTS